MTTFKERYPNKKLKDKIDKEYAEHEVCLKCGLCKTCFDCKCIKEIIEVSQ